MPASITLKAIGLNIQPNQLDPQSVPPGSLSVASNVIIKRDNVIESRRGYKLYGTPMGATNDRAKQLTTYKGRIIRHFSNQLQFDTLELNDLDESVFDTFCGTYLEPKTGRRMRFLESNGNMYFTTSEGIKKISAATAAQLTTACPFITQAGGIKALDLQARLAITLGDQSGFLPQDSAVAYRQVWGVNDANNNEILGTPSQRAVVFNPLINLELEDFNRLLNALDDVSFSLPASLISDGDYFSTLNLPATASANDLLDNLIALTVKLDDDILYADQVVTAPLQISTATISTGVATINFSVGNPQNYLVSGSKIKLLGFTPTTGTLNGPQVVSTVTPTTITFNTTATGAVATTNATINSNEYEFLTPPSVPGTPPSDQELVAIQTYLDSIIIQLQSEPDTGTPPTISAASQTAFITPLDITTSANVILTFSIPQGVTTDTFYQIYRSDIAQATGAVSVSDLAPNDELRLVIEGFPTLTDISNGFITILDTTPQSFAGAFLYTNPTTGEGILQANDVPPFALDINKFKNVAFYANTRTKFSQLLDLLGVANMIADYNSGDTPAITITDGVTTNTYHFVTGLQQIITVTTVADVAGSLAGTYFTLNNANNTVPYYVWYKVSGVGTDPMVANRIGIQVNINTGDSANTVAEKTSDALGVFNLDFSTSFLANVITVTNVEQGPADAPTAGTSGFVVAVIQSGRGEDASINQVLLSTSISPAQAVDETARSLVHVINRNPNEIVYAFYLSGIGQSPGQIQFESRILGSSPFYILGNNSNTGSSFNPDISPSVFISSISVGNPTIITTATPHGLLNQQQVVITNTDSTPIVDGLYTITYINSTQFSIPVNVTVAGTQGAMKAASTTLTATNSAKSHRIYFSKLLQPEAVPATNFIDVGAQDKEILRIFPLRDSLFVFKEDGLFRISGETAPFNLALFDSSTILISADSLDVSNNLIYGWTTQGIVATSEAGVNIISRPIDIDILKLATAQFTSFPTATWGIGYESDNSYTVYTVQETTDTLATIGYRYSTLTNSWTTFDKTATCGVINSVNDTQYLGAGDVNFLEQERKNFNRTDYADRQFIEQLIAGNYYGNQLQLIDITTVSVGDVITQDQFLSIYLFNQLLKKFDTDPIFSPHTYVANNTMAAGQNIRTHLDNLLTQLANDPGRTAEAGHTAPSAYLALQSITALGTITNISASNPAIITTSVPHGLQDGRIVGIFGSDSTPSVDGTFQVTVLTSTTFSIPIATTGVGTTGSYSVLNDDFRDVESSFNSMVALLNNDLGSAFHNYHPIDHDTLFEAIITNVNILTKRITLNNTLDFMIGPLTVYKAISSVVEWSSITFGNPMTLKHIREATLMFENKAFTNATMGFSSDLVPAPQSVPFAGSGVGIFGYTGIPATNTHGQTGNTGFGYGFFGGIGNAAPFRTYVPRDLQRCRFLNCSFTHMAAREQYAIFGLTLYPNDAAESTRGYR